MVFNELEQDFLCLASRGRNQQLESLLAAQDEISIDTRCEALVLAARTGKVETCQLLIDHGANPNYPGYRSINAFQMAEQENRRRVTELFASFPCDEDSSAEPEALSDEPSFDKELFLAAKTNDLNELKIRIHQLGKEIVNQRDDSGYTLLMHASHRGFLTVVEELLRVGADVNAANNAGQTALNYSELLPLTRPSYWQLRRKWAFWMHVRRQKRIHRLLLDAGGCRGQQLISEGKISA
ncbi:MAG: ankyrin repeat domain-containing protein, partial [Planctomycetota bacterium]